MPATSTRFPPALPVRQIAVAAQALVDLLDAFGGDVELEDGDPAESDGDDRDAAWLEWHSMRGPSKRGANFALGAEDAEDDDPDSGPDEDEPAFDRQSCAIANLRGSGPGCRISDEDYGAEERGEVDEGACGHTARYGIDQTKPISDSNPEVA